MIPVVLITGLMRSGTSLAAQVVHRLMYQAAPVITVPYPPSWHSDWECPRLTTSLMLGREIDWPGYLEWRRAMAAATRFKGISIKSPFLAVRWREVLESVQDRYVVRVVRNEADVAASIAKYPELLEREAEVREALPAVEPDFLFDYDACIDQPWDVIGPLAEALGSDPLPALDVVGALTTE